MRIGSCVHAYRKSKGVSLRTMAKEIGTNYSTLDRFEHGEFVDSRNFVKIFKWLLDIDPSPKQLILKPTK